MANTKTKSVKDSNLETSFLALKTAIELGQVSCLSKVKYKPQVEVLNRILLEAKSKRAKAIDEHCWITKDRPTVAEDADYAIYPFPRITKYILEDLCKLLKREQISSLKEPLDKLSYLIWDTIKTYDEASLDTPKQILLLKAIIKSLKSKQFSDTNLVVQILKNIYFWRKDWKTVNQLGFTDQASLVNALKEFSKYLPIPSSKAPTAL